MRSFAFAVVVLIHAAQLAGCAATQLELPAYSDAARHQLSLLVEHLEAKRPSWAQTQPGR